MSWQLGRSRGPRRRSCSAASPGTSARARPRRSSPWSRRSPRSRSPAGSPSRRSRTWCRPPTSSLIAGYALGGGARASRSARSRRLVSNFWLGQGPWTPWQMAGWGLVGLLGAWLAARHRRRLGRLGLAAVCALAGLRLRRAARLLADGHLRRRAVARPLPGALGPRACRSTSPTRPATSPSRWSPARRWCGCCSASASRFEFAWGARRAGGAAGGAARRRRACSPACSWRRRRPADGPTPRAAARRGVAWLARAQNDDGGFGSAPGEPSSAGDDRLGGARARGGGRQPARPRSRRRDADRLPAPGTVGEISTTGDLERTILALARRGAQPAPLRGPRPGRRAARAGAAATARVDGQVNLTAFGDPRAAGRRSADAGLARSARLAARRTRTTTAAGASRRAPPSDAGHAPAPRCRPWPRPGAAAGDRAGRLVPAQRQRRGGGFALGGSGVVNAQSTAWAVQGLVAAGRRPGSVRDGGRSPLDYLAHRQAGDGHYRYSRIERPDPGLGHRPGAGRGRAAQPSRSPAVPPRERGRRRRPGAGSAIRRGAPAGGSDRRRRRPAPSAGPASARRRADPRATPDRGPPRSPRPALRAGAGASPAASARLARRTASAGGSRGPAIVVAAAGVAGRLDRRRRLPARVLALAVAALRLVPAAAPVRLATALAFPRWTSRRRSAPGAPTRPTGPSRSTARRSRSCSSSPAGRPTTT